jgi:hypothetical protein
MVLPWRLFFDTARRKAAYVGLLAVAVLGAFAVGSTAFVERAQSILDPSSSGDRGAGRTDLWAAAWNGYTDHPALGLGAGNFRAQALDLLQTTPGVDTKRNYVLQAKAVHNAYLEVLTDLGPIGLALFLAVLFLSGRYLLLSYRRARDAGVVELERFSIAVFLSLVGYSVSAVFLSNQLGKLVWTLVGLAIAMDVVTRRLAPRVAAVPEAEAPAEPTYDLDVREQILEQRERRVSEELQALRLERSRLARLEQRLLGRLEEAAEPPPAEPPEEDDRERRLDERVAQVTRRELELMRAHAAVALRERAVAEREQELERAAAAVPEPAPEPEPVPVAVEPAPVPVAVEPEPVPEPPAPLPPPVPQPEPAPEPIPAAAGGLPTLNELEQLVAQHAHEFPDQAEEWRYYTVFLRDYADYDGRLPAQFDYLVFDVFAPLLERR